VARQFARLKLRLIRNGLRAPQYMILFAIGAGGAALLAGVGFLSLAGLRGNALAANATLVTFAAVTVCWTVVPLLGFGTDETLDPQRLALLPLTRRELLSGLLAAALVGVAPLATGIALSGAIIGLAPDLLGAFLIALSVVATLVLCVVASRVLIAALAPLLRSRRGRDLMVMTITLAIFVPQAFRFFRPAHRNDDATRTFSDIARRVRYTPFGWAGWAATEAGKSHVLAAVAGLAAVAALIGVLLWVWSIAIPRAMTASDISASARTDSRPGRRHSALFPRFVPARRRRRAAAVAVKELRYYVRDPRRRAPLISALLIPALVLFQTLRDGSHRPAATTLLGLIALLPASGLTLNQFGLDGAALWSTIVTGNDPRSDLIGKNIATAIVLAPLVIIPTLITAALTHGWSYAPLTIGLAPGMLGVVLAIGDLVSVYAPYALPDRRNPLAANPGQGCVGGVAAKAALAVDALVLVPVGLITVFTLSAFDLPVATVLAVGFATAYGGGAWVIGRNAAARRVWWRMPELLDAVSPRHAG
jgi:ABC-2 type transport system permease protein